MRLIDADALIYDIKSGVYPASMTYTIAVDIAESLIESAPTVDAVPVVRCGECEHYNTSGCAKGLGWCESIDRGASDNWYCANGAKMEGEE